MTFLLVDGQTMILNMPNDTPMDLTWKIGFSTSCLHAAEASARGQLVADLRMAEAIADPARRLRCAITAAGLPRDIFWRHLVGLSATVENNVELGELALIKTVGSRQAAGIGRSFGGLISDIESAVRRALPDMLDELVLRIGPLRQQWEVVGPCMLQAIARWTDPCLITGRADVVVIHPSLGGGGAAHLEYNSVRIEGMLANPVSELPEIVRLAWLLSQINLDLPTMSEAIDSRRLPLIAELGMLPVAIQAGEHAEVLQMETRLIEQALNAWHIVTPPGLDPVDILARWWETYVETRPPWDIALAALDRMIF